MIDRVQNELRTAPAPRRLFAALLGPPLVWLTTLQLVYGVAAFACDGGTSRLPLHVTTAAALTAIAALIHVAWQNLRASESVGTASAGTSAHLSRFLAVGGLVLAAQFLVVLVAQELAVVLLGPCQ